MKPTASAWYAVQLESLMRRHNLTPVEIERRTAADGHGGAISQVTVRRMLKGETRTEPEPVTLKRIAKCVDEPFALAFPPPISDDAKMFSVLAALEGEDEIVAIADEHGAARLSTFATGHEKSHRLAVLIVDGRASAEEVDGFIVALRGAARSRLRRKKS